MLFLTLAGSAFSALPRPQVICRLIHNATEVLQNAPGRIA
jgi:hypothetical protein